MPTFPLSPRLAVTPWWAALRADRFFVERGAPLLEIRVGGRSPLPPAGALRQLAEAPDVRGVWLKVERLAVDGGQATLHECVEALAAARAQGRLVVGEFDFVGNGELLLASVCDRAWVRPGAQLWCVGLGTTMRFYGDLLERFGARFEVEAVGEYKSFGETFGRGFASAPNREAMTSLVGDLQASWEEAVARGRPKVGLDGVRAAVNRAPLSAEEAVEAGLFDGALYPDQVAAEVTTLLGKEPRVVPFMRWAKSWARATNVERLMEGRAAIPVVVLSGAVLDGSGIPGMEGILGTPVVAALDELREAEGVKAVVLRVNSPGGSAAASDLLWRAVQRLGQSKPVVASFGDVSASGGFYLSAAAQEIVAHEATITGSIGVIAGKPVLRGAMEAQGIHSEDLLMGPQADVFAETSFSPNARARMRAGLEATYRGFVGRVAEGRKRPYEEIEPHARGRVWSGRRAHELGLIDHLGGLPVAQARAAALAGVEAGDWRSWAIRPVPPGGWLRRLVRGFATEAMPELAALTALPPAARMLMARPAEAMALWPYELDIR